MMELHEASVFAMDAATPVALASPHHGPRHWHDVARIGYALGGGVDLEVIFLFAVLHDTQRVNEWDDPNHGNRAEDLAEIMRERGVVHLTNEQFETLGTALGDHDRGYTHKSRTIGRCWDADRLTLGRVGKQPDPAYMSNPEVRQDFDAALDIAEGIMASGDLPWSEIVSIYEGRRRDHATARSLPA